MYRLLSKRDPSSTVRKLPLEDWKIDSGETMNLAVRINYKLQRDVVRRAAVRKIRLRTDSRLCRRHYGISEG